MKKTGLWLSLLGLLLASTTLVAAHPWETHWPEKVWVKRWEKNFLLGLMAGHADREGSINVFTSYGGFPNIPQTDVVRDSSDTGFIYGLFAGYQGKCDKWLLGGEFSLEHHPIDETHAFAFSDPANFLNWQGTSQYHRNWISGFTFRGGYQITEYLLPYVRLGIETAQDTYEVNLSTNGAQVPPLYLYNEKWIYRFLSGIGIEIPVYCTAFTARMEYQIHSKGKTMEIDKVYTDGVINPITNAELQPKTQSVIFAIVRNFD